MFDMTAIERCGIEDADALRQFAGSRCCHEVRRVSRRAPEPCADAVREDARSAVVMDEVLVALVDSSGGAAHDQLDELAQCGMRGLGGERPVAQMHVILGGHEEPVIGAHP